MLARIQKLDLNRPGAIEGLLEFHYRTFGPARMEGDSAGGDGGEGSGGDAAGAGKGDAGGAAGDGKGEADGDGDTLAAEFAEARTGRKAAEKALSEITGKTVTQVRKAFKDAKGDAVKAVAALTGDAGVGDGKPGKPAAEGEPVDEKKIRETAEREAREANDSKLVRSGVKVLAADTFANPVDALHNLDLADYEVDDDGELTDPDKVKRDLTAVLTKNPHYAKKGGQPKVDRSQGSRGEGKADVKPGLGRLRHAYETQSKTKT